MKKFKTVARILSLVTVTSFVLSSCGGNSNTQPKPTDANNENSQNQSAGSATTEKITVDFWTAPQVVQFNYWSQKAEVFNKESIKIGDKIIEVVVQQMPESPSSEAGIQNAIATGSAPAISENINRGFAKTLASSDVIYNLAEESWFNEVVKSRSMDTILPGWEIDGAQYVLPVYVNPMVYQYNMKALKLMGIDTPPVTVEEYKQMIEKFRANKDTTLKDAGIIATFYRPSLTRPDQWWDRWFDFQMQYNAFTGGKGWVEDDKLVLDKEVSKKVFELYGLLGNTVQLSELSTQWSAESVPYVFSINAPWEIQLMREAGKKYGLEEDYVYWQPIVQNKEDKPYCFGDSKGLVLYKTDNITPEMHDGAIEFIKWVYNAENTAKTDIDWLKATNMLPARGDLLENPELKAYMGENVELQGLAPFVPYTVPSMASEKMTDIQTAFTEDGFGPYIEQTSKISDFNLPDPTPFVDDAFKSMEDVLAK